MLDSEFLNWQILCLGVGSFRIYWNAVQILVAIHLELGAGRSRASLQVDDFLDLPPFDIAFFSLQVHLVEEFMVYLEAMLQS